MIKLLFGFGLCVYHRLLHMGEFVFISTLMDYTYSYFFVVANML